jgi:hypothetical protein
MAALLQRDCHYSHCRGTATTVTAEGLPLLYLPFDDESEKPMGIRSSLSVNIRSSLATLNVHSTAEQRNAKSVLQNSTLQNIIHKNLVQKSYDSWTVP